jgi:cation diffusion facilitator family transporter
MPTRHMSDRSLERTRERGGSRTTVLIALAANAVIMVAKLAAGLISGSTALLAETAHSLADTTNQGFLLTSIALAGRPPDEEQPFGYGRQRFLWTFLASILMFVAGAVFAIGYGVYELIQGGEATTSYGLAWATLIVALLAEGSSWLRAVRQTRREADDAGRPWRRHVRSSRDPNVKMVLFEDSAALIGIVIAAVGIGLGQITGKTFWDPAASVVIGVLLIGVAVTMARDTGHLLVGAAALPEERETIEQILERSPGVDDVKELLTMVLGPRALLVAARIDLADDVDSADDVEQMASALDREIRQAVPDVTEVFLDATPGDDRAVRDPETSGDDAPLRPSA